MLSLSMKSRWQMAGAQAARCIAMGLLTCMAHGAAQARDAVWAPAPTADVAPRPASSPAAHAPLTTLLPFHSDEGMALLARATARRDFPALANQFEPQSNIAYCGPTSAAIVLNALQAGRPDLPIDRSRLRQEDGRYLPPVVELAVPRHTQESVTSKGSKTRAQVLGEPLMIEGKARRDPGFQLRQLDETLRAHGAVTRLVIADDKQPDETIRRDLIENLQHPGDYVIVNYRRKEAGQRGGAHLSPLGAYDSASDAFLVMDVNPASAGWVWMPAATLIKAMRTFDTQENRGYILVR